MDERHFQVAIIGGGPSGLLSALLLSRAGVRCVLFERRKEPMRHPRAMGLTRRTCEILAQCGVLDRLPLGRIHPPEFAIANWEASLVGEIYGRVPWITDDADFTPCGARHVPQPKVEAALLAALENESRASILFDHEVFRLEQDGDRVQLEVRRGGADDLLQVTADWAIGADGAGSRVRDWTGIGAEGPGDQGHFINTWFRAEFGGCVADRQAVLHQVLNQRGFETFVSVNGDDEWLMHHFLQPGEDSSGYGPDELGNIIREMSGLPDVPVEILGVTTWVMSPKIALALGNGRVFLTGDAAARLSPAGGLGMNTGLQAAHNLAWKLAAVINGAPRSILESYELERLPLAQKVFSVSDGFRDEVWQIVSAGLDGDFDTVRALASHSRRAGSGLREDLGFRYESGAFIPGTDTQIVPDDGGFRAEAVPGGRAPHVELGREGERFSILRLFGRGFALAVAGRADEWIDAGDAVAGGGNGIFGFDLDVIAVGGGEGFSDINGTFLQSYGLIPGGAVLVRPDGIVGCRWPTRPTDPLGSLRLAINGVFGP